MKYEPKFIAHLFDYMIFADRAAFESARELSREAYHAAQAFSFGSIHNLLVHQMVAQKTWLRRFNGEEVLGQLENHLDHPTREALIERWPAVHAGLREFAAKQTSESINATLHTKRSNGEPLVAPLGAFMMHVADHGTYHRGQLASMLKAAGRERPVYTPYFRFAVSEEGLRDE